MLALMTAAAGIDHEPHVQSRSSTKPSLPRCRASDVWLTLRDASTDEVLMVLYGSAVRVVQDRIRAFYEKYLPQSREITEEQVAATGAKPGTPKFQKVFQTMIVQRLNARPRKVVEPEPIPEPVPVMGGRGRKQA